MFHKQHFLSICLIDLPTVAQSFYAFYFTFYFAKSTLSTSSRSFLPKLLLLSVCIQMLKSISELLSVSNSSVCLLSSNLEMPAQEEKVETPFRANALSSWVALLMKPSLIKTSAAPPPPMPLVGSCYPTRPEDIFVEQPFKQLKETFEQKSRQHYLNLDQFQGKTIETSIILQTLAMEIRNLQVFFQMKVPDQTATTYYFQLPIIRTSPIIHTVWRISLMYVRLQIIFFFSLMKNLES